MPIGAKLCRVVPAPDFQSGGAGFQTRGNALPCSDPALALVRMPQAPQLTRTFFVTSTRAVKHEHTIRLQCSVSTHLEWIYPHDTNPNRSRLSSRIGPFGPGAPCRQLHGD